MVKSIRKCICLKLISLMSKMRFSSGLFEDSRGIWELLPLPIYLYIYGKLFDWVVWLYPWKYQFFGCGWNEFELSEAIHEDEKDSPLNDDFGMYVGNRYNADKGWFE